jgi:SAM-dependent methyltransferase
MMDVVARRSVLTRHLLGAGIEIGPGHAPLVVPRPGLDVQYLDRWEPDENAELFPELDGATFPKPDIVADLNKEALQAVRSESLDFLVASHILEHLANPLRILIDIYRVLKPGGVLLILLPDRRKTFDQGRDPTSLDHIISDFEMGMVEVDDEHLVEFISHVSDPGTLAAIQADSSARQAALELHRRRSIHVHCWTLDEFVPLIVCSIERFGNLWQFVDGVATEEQGPDSIEFGMILQKAVSDVSPSDTAAVFQDSFHQWRSERDVKVNLRQAAAQQVQTVAVLNAMRTFLHSARRELGRRLRTLEALLRTRTFPYTRTLRQLYGRIRSEIGLQGRGPLP